MTWSDRFSPFQKQCFVTLGVVMNAANVGLVHGYPTALLPQLRKPGSPISIDDSSASWIAAIVGIAMLPGNLVIAYVMGRYGRKVASIISVIPCIASWLLITTATNITVILIARCLQGFNLGMVSNFGPILIGEYTSPDKRGMFLTTISLAICAGTSLSHALGLYMTWQNTALVFAIVSILNLIIVLLSPESPSWLVNIGRYEEGRKAFKWLRGDDEDEELKEMIATHMNLTINDKKVENMSVSEVVGAKVKYCKETVIKKGFYKPVLLVIILYTLCYFGGAPIFASYTIETVEALVGKDTDINLIIISVGIQRLFTTALAAYVVKKLNRRTILLNGVLLNILMLVISAVYAYFKALGLLPFDHMLFGVLILHVHMFSTSISTTTLPFIIAGELFPLEYRGVSSAISVFSIIPNMVFVLKTFPYLLASIGYYGAYGLYAVVMSLCLIVVWWFLPETKDRTLQDIENEIRGLTLKDMKVSQPLTRDSID